MPSTPSRRPLDPTVEAALKAASALAHEWRQDWLGVEHLFIALLDGESGDGPVHDFLAGLSVDPAEVRKTVRRFARERRMGPHPAFVPFTPRLRLVLDRARAIMRRRREKTIRPRHVMEALLREGRSLPAVAIGCSLLPRAEARPVPAGWERVVRKMRRERGDAWVFPLESASGVLNTLTVDPARWDRRGGLYRFRVNPWMATSFVECFARDGQFWVTLCGRSGRWFRSQTDRLRAAVAALPGAVAVPPARMLAEWPLTSADAAGRVHRAYFAGRKPAGFTREFQAADADACLELYSLLEDRGQVPEGYRGEFALWLDGPDRHRYVTEREGQIIGCGGFTPLDSVARDPEVDCVAMLVFGLVHPDAQRTGAGTSQLAVRLLAGHTGGSTLMVVWATPFSAGWLERIGFAFTRIDLSGPAPSLYGTLLFTDEDAAFLHAWLAGT